MKTLTLILLTFSLLPAAAQRAYSNREQKQEAQKLQEAFALLNTSDTQWSIIVQTKEMWEAPLSKQQRASFAGSCYTLREVKTTFCNASWVDHADLVTMGWTLAHERGHIDCNCVEEWKAEAAAAQVLRK